MPLDPKRQLGGRGPGTFNEDWFDAVVRHQIGLLRVTGGIRNQIFKLLDATEADMAAKIERRLRNHKGLTTPASVRRMQSVIAATRAARLTAWKQVDEVWLKEIVDLAKSQPEFMNSLLANSVPVEMGAALPPVSQLEAIVRTKPFEGKTLKEWAKDARRADLRRIEDQIKIGMVQGESSRDISRRVVGTKVQRGRNGVTEITRRNAAGITRTVVIGVSNQANRAFYEANTDVFSKELYTATLDGRTTLICSSLDGRQFPIGEGPIPPLHFNCRSVRVAVLDSGAVGDRPAREFTQKGLLREFTKQEGLPSISSRAGLPRGTKGQFDSFSRGRMRELTGTVPAKVSYQQWLTRQSTGFQNDTLGETRGVLFRKGGLKLDRFVNRAGDTIPLSQLAKANAKAFRDAGLDPKDFV